MEFSFIIPVYNCVRSLGACVDSIRACGAEAYEILLIDDGSADGSGALCDTLAERYPEIRVFHQENRGVSAARNRGIREAEGTYILFVDGDDTVDAPLLNRVLECARCDEADLTIFGMTFDYYHHGSCYRSDPVFYQENTLLHREQWGAALNDLFAHNALSPVWNKVYRRELLLNRNLALDEKMFLYEDLEFSLRYLACCDTIRNAALPVYHYRQSEDEGNAGRRLARIGRICQVTDPIEKALRSLQRANPAIPEEQIQTMLLSLYQVLAREKIGVSDLSGVRQICRDYARWCSERGYDDPQSRFHGKLIRGKAGALLFDREKTALRHWVAVRVKAFLRGRKHGH